MIIECVTLVIANLDSYGVIEVIFSNGECIIKENIARLKAIKV